MTKNFSLIVILLLSCIAPNMCYSQFAHRFSHGIGGTSFESGLDVATDIDGNVFITGAFRDIVDFNPGTSVHNLVGTDENDAFLAKYTATGNFVWAHSFGSKGLQGGGTDIGRTVAADEEGNVFFALSFGTFEDSIDMDPGPGIASFTCTGFSNGILAKYDSNGNFVWAIPLLVTNASGIEDIVIDATGNVHVIGAFTGTLDFDSGSGTQLLTSNGNNDIFVAKYDNDGNYIWAINMGGTGSDGGLSIALAPDADLLITGTYRGTVDFDPGPGVTNLLGDIAVSDMYFARYDANGNFQWANSIRAGAAAIISDSNGNAIITGQYSGNLDFDPGPNTFILSPSGGRNIYLAKYDVGGNFILAKAIGSQQGQTLGNMVSDGGSGFYISGSFSGTINFNPDSTTTPVLLTSVALRDGYFARYNGNAVCLGAGAIAGTNTDDNISIATMDGDNIFVTGTFAETADFDPGPGVINRTSLGISDISLAKYQFGGGVLPVSLSQFRAQCSGNGTQLNWTTQQEFNSRYFIIERSIDGINYKDVAEITTAGNSSIPINYHYIDDKTNGGMAFYRLRHTDINGSLQYSQIINANCGKMEKIHAFPNPFTTNIFIRINKKIGKGQILIYSVAGHLLKQMLFNAVGGEVISVDMSGLVSGNYFIQIKDMANEILHSIKVIKN